MADYIPPAWDWVREQVEQYEGSGGKAGTTLRDTGLPVIIVTYIGRKTGANRKAPLMRVVTDDGKYVLVASKGGAPENPEWYHNFLGHPEVDLQDGPVKTTYRVRLLEDGPERDDWWQHAVATWPTYAEYQKKTDRLIPVFLLEPKD